MNSNKYNATYKVGLVIIWPLLVAALLCFVYYPGFMSYDSIHALTGAREGVSDSIWPPMVSYIWWFVDRVSDNPSMMHFAQVSLLLVAISSLVYSLTKKVSASIAFQFVYLSIPVIAGTITVIWKDVLTAAFLLAGFAIAVAVRKVKRRSLFYLAITFSFALIFIGISTRHNSVSAAFPLIIAIAWFIAERIIKQPKRQVFFALIAGFVICISFFGIKTQLDHYSLPTFNQLGGTEEFFPPIQKLELAGASICSGENLFGNSAPGMTLEEISKTYDPRHVNLSQGLLSQVKSGKTLNDAWLKAIQEQPFCFTHQHRQMAKYLLGLNFGDQFLITDPGISENPYGIALQPSSLRDKLVSATISNSGLFFLRPWFILMLSTIAIVLVVSFRKCRELFSSRLLILGSLYLAGVGYLTGLILFGNAADARLPFFATTAFMIVSFVIYFELLSELVRSKINTGSKIGIEQ
ncbi:hypothetical protein M2118_001188 [Aurantimicrobium minutum]|uniref:hypothetical protein n=1 Tax=Aurantimicrobium minutum TaxID=708131 RepID=UPI002474F07D|nr:hypothetical protein [Aurantimicrobium minutum]MDH6278215.1 hypothetical protein [Aurantimicrobium minutum]